jgi:hypothetical protein
MKWFVLFLMMQGPNETFQEYYHLKSPSFSSAEECIMYVGLKDTNRALKDHMAEVYPFRPVDKVFCVDEKAIDKLFGGTEA